MKVKTKPPSDFVVLRKCMAVKEPHRRGEYMTVLLKCSKVSKIYGDKSVLKAVDLEIIQGQKIGIVGANGAGKTTLAKLLTGEEEVSSGEISWYRDGLSIGYMKQATDYEGLEETLSGGEKTRVLLNKVFYSKHDLMILDEPTNHLDYEGVKWLIKKVRAFRGTVIIISHDRYFLDACITHIAEIEGGQLTLFKGNYSWYREEKQRQYEAAMHHYLEEEKVKDKIQGQIEALKDWSSKAHRDAAKKARETGNKKGGREFNRAKAKKMDQAVKSRIKRLQKIELSSKGKPEEEKGVLFKVEEAAKSSHFILEAKDIGKSYGKKTLFSSSSFYINRGEKIGLYGRNGCGKSTLIKGILEEVPLEGELRVSRTKRIGYISQEVIDLEEDKAIRELFPTTSQEADTKLRTALANMGFSSEALGKKVATLSLGERMKLKLLKMIGEGCEILILDEPTNHIDLHVREQLEETLLAYKGTLILVTHDRYMLEKLCDKLLVFENEKITRYEYGLKEYLLKQKQFSEGKTKNLNSCKKQLEEKMVIENKIAYLLGKMSMLSKEADEYKVFEREYEETLKLQQ